MPFTLPARPEISLLAILGYSLVAFSVFLVFTPWFVSFLHRNKIGKQLRVETVDGRDPTIFRTYHQKKFGTPTMGGLLIWGSILATVLLSRVLSFTGVVEHSLLQRGQVYLPLFVMVTLGILGGVDDYINIIGTDEERLRRFVGRSKYIILALLLLLLSGLSVLLWDQEIAFRELPYGIYVYFGAFGIFGVLAVFFFLVLALGLGGGRVDSVLATFLMGQGKKRGLGVLPKILSLLVISVIGALWFSVRLDINTIHVPFWGDLAVGWWYVPIFVFVVMGTANAVNFTDGLDGLAGGLLVISFGSFAILAYLQSLALLSAFCAVCVGAIAAFLWHNVPPAIFFMGDTGSLPLGGTLAVIALMIDDMLLLPFIGFVFVVEMLSVIIQLTSKRLRGGKKVFLAAPIHHHFEALGWGESKVTMRLWIVGAFAALLGVMIGIAG